MEYTPIIFTKDLVNDWRTHYANLKALNAFAQSADFSSKEEYLKWVSAYKIQIKLLEPYIRSLKKMRKMSKPEYHPSASAYASAYGECAKFLYECRVENKQRSWAIKQQNVKIAEVA